MAIISESAADDPATLAAGLLADDAQGDEAARADSRPEEILPGVGTDEMPLRRVLSIGGWSTGAVLFGLNLVDEFDRVALSVLGPDIQKTFGFGDAMLTFLSGIGGLVVFVGAVPFGYLADRTSRTRLVGFTSVLWSVFAALGGMVQASWQLLATRLLNGVGKGNGPVHASLLTDTYPIEGRGRIFALHNLANPIGLAVAPLLAGGIATLVGGDEGWRWAFMLLSVPALVLAVAAFALKEPPRGRYEQESVLGAAEHLHDDGPRVSLSAGFERLKKIKTFYYVMVALGVIGFAASGTPAIFNLLLEDKYGLDALGRGTVGSVIAIGSAIGALFGGRFADRAFRTDPGRLVKLGGFAIAAIGITHPLSLLMPNLVLLVLVQTISGAFVAAPLVGFSAVIAAVVPYRLRGLGFAMVGIYLFFVGGLLGGVLAGIISDTLSERAALLIMVPPAALTAGLVVAYAGRFVKGDIALAANELREEQEERQRVALAADGDVPLLQVRNLDYSYGPLQVLFDVSLDVRKGEVLALLGTNGAGKSTALRAVSGLGYPDRGAIRFEGRTITYASAQDRVRLGIVQVPGGKAVFPTLTVGENLVAGAWTMVWDTDRVRSRMDAVLSLFPRLAERIDQPAGTLSGGERQMLALAKAMLLEPKLLVIDELSLGLAPAVVSELLAVVEGLRDEGVTIVLVEQSVNVALAVADRAVFMEKGRVRFEGAAADLLERGDLVRAVFLGGEGG